MNTHWVDGRAAEVKISCVMPAFNEADNLPGVLPELWRQLSQMSGRFEIVLVNDGSRDGTLLVMQALMARYPEIVLLNLSRNFGKEAAITAGLDTAAGDVVVLLDADGQHPVSMLPTMLQEWREGTDIVYAVRRTRSDQSFLHAWLARWFYRLINWGSRVKIPRDAGDFRLMDRCVVDALRAFPERNRFMKGLYAWVGFSHVALDYEPLPRRQGQSSFGIRGAFRLALTGMFAFSTAPLKLLTGVGLTLSLASMFYIVSVVFEYFYWGIKVPGYATLVVSIMFFSGIQLLALGIMSAYVGRIYEEVKNRPLYLVKNRTGLGLRQAS